MRRLMGEWEGRIGGTRAIVGHTPLCAMTWSGRDLRHDGDGEGGLDARKESCVVDVRIYMLERSCLQSKRRVV